MNFDEIQELACLMLGKDYESMVNNYEYDTIDEAFYIEYGVDLDNFYRIVEDLIKFTPTWKLSLTGQIYQGFIVQENDKGLMRAIIKEKV